MSAVCTHVVSETWRFPLPESSAGNSAPAGHRPAVKPFAEPSGPPGNAVHAPLRCRRGHSAARVAGGRVWRSFLMSPNSSMKRARPQGNLVTLFHWAGLTAVAVERACVGAHPLGKGCLCDLLSGEAPLSAQMFPQPDALCVAAAALLRRRSWRPRIPGHTVARVCVLAKCLSCLGANDNRATQPSWLCSVTQSAVTVPPPLCVDLGSAGVPGRFLEEPEDTPSRCAALL